MARTARKESEEAHEVRPPDFEKAIKIMRADIMPSQENMDSSRGELSGYWKAVSDDCHVNKAAAKVFYSKILGSSVENRDDFLRGLYGLMRAAEIGISRDLVARAEGVEETMPVEGEARTEAVDLTKQAMPVPSAAGFTGANLPPEVQPMVEAGTAKPRKSAAKPRLVTVN